MPASVASVPALHTERFSEHVDLNGASVRVDRQAGILRGVKILGLASRNGRVYRSGALDAAIPLYEAARVNVNHPAGSPAVPRGYEERIGSVRNVRRGSDGLYADFHFNPKHRLAEQLIWDASHAPENVGFSHNVLGRTSREGGQTVVEEILQVHSVDLVPDPATTRGLFEQSGAPQQQDPAVTLRGAHLWDDRSKAWVPLSAQEAASAPQAAGGSNLPLLEANQRLERENRELREELHRLTSQQSQQARSRDIDARITAAGIPAELNTAVFREQCHAAPDDEAVRRLIEARLEDARLLCGYGRPRSVERRAENGDGSLDAAGFAASLL